MKIYNIITYSITELQKFEAEKLNQLAQNYKVPNIEGLSRNLLIFAISEAQENFISQKIIFQNQ